VPGHIEDSARSPRLPRIVAVSNQKGGEGKTTTAVNLAASLAAAERRVLLIDLDPQANASSSLGVPRDTEGLGSYHLLLRGSAIEDVSRPTELPTLSIVAASTDLAGAEVELVGLDRRDRRLQQALREPSPSAWDFIIIDCPPSLGLLTINALAAADTVLVPMQPRYFSLEGLGSLMHTVQRVRATLNPELRLEGILFCMVDRRLNLTQQVMQEVAKHFGEAVFETQIPPNVRLSESPSFGKPALLYDIESKGAQAYLQLANEFLARLSQEARP